MATAGRTDRLPLQVHEHGTVEGRTADRVLRTHSARLWFLDDIVVKRKRPVDLGFLDFRSLAARTTACEREVELNRRLDADTYLGVADVVDDHDQIVDAAVVMKRLPDDARLSTRALAGDDLTDCVRRLGRRLAMFHAAQPPADTAASHAGPEAIRTNWTDNLAVLADHPELADAGLVADLSNQVQTWLDGRDDLFNDRISAGLVRDGHGDLVADDVFCLPDGPRVLDCLDFADRYRIADVVLDLAFLAMDLERLGRPDLAALLADTHEEVLGVRHPRSLLHHSIAYRASVRAKVACLGDDPFPQDVVPYLDLMARHLFGARARLVLVGGLPGTGKSTLAAGLVERLGWVVLRTDEVRKDLLGQDHDQPAGPEGYDPRTTAATYAEVLDRAQILLRHGQSVVLDASWADATHRKVARAIAHATHSDLVELRCAAPAAVARHRVAVRTNDPSDADVAVHDAMAAVFQPWPTAVVLDADQPRADIVDAAMKAMGMAAGVVAPVASRSSTAHPPAARPPASPTTGDTRGPTTSTIPEASRPATSTTPGTASTRSTRTHPDRPRPIDDTMEDSMEDSMATRPTDRQGLEVLDPDTCLRLLDLSPVGRIAFVSAGEPVILPVNHVRDGRGVAFRTASGLTLHAATVRMSMAFEVDGYDQETRTGWSVLLRGTCDLVEDPEDIARLEHQDLHPWADTVERPHWIRIHASEMSGRRIPDRHAPQD